VAPLVSLGVALGFAGHLAVWSVERSRVVHVLVVDALRGSESHVVVSGGRVLSE
jgi:hypothetical protein